jgi:Uma2 family endonuclease
MTAMVVENGTFTMPHGRPFTVRDLEDFPDDGNRYELIDGVLLVSSAPGPDHQTVVLELAIRLRAVRPDGFRVFVAPFAVEADDNTEVQPDVLVAMANDITKKNLPKAPLLAVEVLSPSTAIIDLNTKKALYERLGTPSYWVIDPINPTLTVFELDENGKYQQIAEVAGAKAFEATQPFPIRIVPSELLEG